MIARTATKNPAIIGRTLYLTKSGFWTLNTERARYFETPERAEEHLRKDLAGCRVEKIRDAMQVRYQVQEFAAGRWWSVGQPYYDRNEAVAHAKQIGLKGRIIEVTS